MGTLFRNRIGTAEPLTDNHVSFINSSMLAVLLLVAQFLYLLGLELEGEREACTTVIRLVSDLNKLVRSAILRLRET